MPEEIIVKLILPKWRVRLCIWACAALAPFIRSKAFSERVAHGMGRWVGAGIKVR